MGAIKHFKQRNRNFSDSQNVEASKIPIFKPFRPWENEQLCDEEAENYSGSEGVACDSSEQSFCDQESLSDETSKCCPYCPATFTRKDNLTRHFKIKHQNKFRNPQCPFCNKKLSRQDAVQRHMTTCTKSREQYFRRKAQIVQIMNFSDHEADWTEKRR